MDLTNLLYIGNHDQLQTNYLIAWAGALVQRLWEETRVLKALEFKSHHCIIGHTKITVWQSKIAHRQSKIADWQSKIADWYNKIAHGVSKIVHRQCKIADWYTKIGYRYTSLEHWYTKIAHGQSKIALKGSGCGSVGRVVASNSRGPRFESSHWQNFIYILNICLLSTVY